jgi:Coatomer epsilon subunit
VQLYIRIDRLDLAESQVKVMKHADEDSTLSMLASAWTNLSVVSLILLWCVVMWGDGMGCGV